MARVAPIDQANEGTPLDELAAALRELFDVVQTENRRSYAREHHFHPSVVTNALRGTKRPGWDFVEDLARAAGHDQQEDLAYLRGLWEKAAKPKKIRIEEILAAERAKNQAEIAQWARREQELTTQIADLTSALEALGPRHARDDGTVQPINDAIAERILRRNSEIESRRRSFKEDIRELAQQLEQERQLRKEAEERCRHYEFLIESYDEVILSYAATHRTDPTEDTELLYLDGLDDNDDEDDAMALVNLLRSKVEELDAKNQDLQSRLKIALDEVEDSRRRTPWYPLPETEPEPARHRRPAAGSAPKREEVPTPGSYSEWTAPKAVNDGHDLLDPRYRSS